MMTQMTAYMLRMAAECQLAIRLGLPDDAQAYAVAAFRAAACILPK
jgi:hypothetical protein